MSSTGKGPRLGHFDFVLLLLVMALSAVGLVLIYSATHDGPLAGYTGRQVVWITAGLVVMAATLLLDYRVLLACHRWLYGGNIALLTLVLLIGSKGGGAQSWFDLGMFRVQPSEFAKILIVLALARFLTGRAQDREDRADDLSGWRLAVSFLYIGVPMLLIMEQPDLGTSLTFVFLWFTMTWMAGARSLHLLLAVLLLAVAAGSAWQGGLIRDYQKTRVMTIFDPFADPLGDGYHLVQSEIALASGGARGMGFLRGAQTQLQFVPEQQTDAIFTVLGEEWGYIGSLVLLLLYAGLLWQATQVVPRAPDQSGRLVAAGLTAVFGFHIFVNVGVITGLVPFTGIPLPFLSYGGSNLLTNMIAIGLLQNIRLREEVSFFAPQDRSVAARIQLATPPRL